MYTSNIINSNGKKDSVIPYDENYMEKISNDLKNSSLLRDVLVIYGIPVTSSYFVYVLGKEYNIVSANISRSISKLFSLDEYNIISCIMKKSINLSPYPEEFYMLNWRDSFKGIIDKIGVSDRIWWRNLDYDGEYPGHYDDILRHGRHIN